MDIISDETGSNSTNSNPNNKGESFKGYQNGANTLLASALECVSAGFRVFPLTAQTKIPLLGSSGFKDATADCKAVEEYWKQHPASNLGIATGKLSSLLVIDVDVKNGKPGLTSIAELQDKFGPFTTKASRTPSGGIHYYFKISEPLQCCVDLLPGIDVRADGGYIVAPPSVCEGKPYEWVNDKPIVEASPQLVTFIRERAYKQKFIAPTKGFHGVHQGSRNDHIFRYACSLRGKGLHEHEILELTSKEALACKPPLGPEETAACVKSALKYKTDFSCTDLGNARRFSALFASQVRYAPGVGWLVRNDGNSWRNDTQSKVMKFAKQVADFIRTDASNSENEQRRQDLLKWEKVTSGRSRIEGLLSLAQSESTIVIDPADLDRSPTLLGTPTGVLDLETGQMVNTDEIITRRIGVVFDPSATCPTFMKFVGRVLVSEELVAFIQRAVGYSLSGRTDEQVFFYLYGAGANGKTTLLNVPLKILGEYHSEISAKDLMREGSRFALARLRGARFVRGSEVGVDQTLNEALIKDLTGGDPVTAEFKGRDMFTFRPVCKVWLYGNHKPVIRDHSPGLWRRVLLIPFEVTIPAEERDIKLEEKLSNEAPGILNWMIEGYRRWREIGLSPPPIVRKAVQQYQADQSNFAEWFSACCTSDAAKKCSSASLDASYRKWCEIAGEIAGSQRQLGLWLTAQGYQKQKQSTMSYLGVRLKNAFGSIQT